MTLDSTHIQIDPVHQIDVVSPYIFGGFMEHMGRCIYEGVYDPSSKHADNEGLRTDVLKALDELHMTMMRYPGGNFVSGYHWQDGVGPKTDRPTLREFAWQSLETNQFGTDEFIALCKRMNWEPMMAANLGTGTPEEARNWVEYCNAIAGTEFADMRVANGNPDPYGIQYWCLGNEMDGPWQIGHVPVEHYAIRAQQAASMMKGCDRNLKFIACGSSDVDMPTFPDWDREVMEYLGGLAHYVSLHRYATNYENDSQNFLAMGVSIDQQIEAVDATCRFVQAKRKSGRRSYLCFDEWNVWYKARQDADMQGDGKFAPHLVEETYNLEDALVVAQFLNSFIRHADVVKIANIAQIVNVIAPIMTRGDDMLLQSIYHVFQLFSEQKSGTALRAAQTGPSFESNYGNAPYVDCSVIHNDVETTLFLVNRSIDQIAPVTLDLNRTISVKSMDQVHHNDLKAANSYEDPKVINRQVVSEVSVSAESVSLELPAASLTRLVVQ